MIYARNILLEFARRSRLGWVKELCYQTLLYDELDSAGIEHVYNVFIAKSDAITDEPIPQAEQKLELYSLEHIEGVNALRSGEVINFCEQGITVLYGQNATGKSGYFRVLEHLAGAQLSNPVKPNIYVEHPASPRCKIKYTLNGVMQPEFEWDNTDATKGMSPFNRITVFSSKYSEYLIKQHGPDTYMLNLFGYTSCNAFYTNYAHLREKVMAECPDKEPELQNEEIASLNIEEIYNNYILALNERYTEKIAILLKSDRGISVEMIQFEGRPQIVIKLNQPERVESILSEGELKALSLALLLADNELKDVKDPIIFDDPVNSLDNNIIRRFVSELIRLDNQMVIFSHNDWFVNSIVKNGETRKYDTNIPVANRVSPKKHILAHELICLKGEKGVRTVFNEKKAEIYLRNAKELLDKEPFSSVEARSVVSELRFAIEQMVDEKVFMNQIPLKVGGTSQSIPWPDLLELGRVPATTVETLREQYSALSDGGEHFGRGYIEDPLDHDELQEIYDKLILL